MTALQFHRLTGYKYAVAAPYRIALPELAALKIRARWFTLVAGLLVVHPGYAWDGASGPTLDTKSTLAASLVHDVLYQCIRAGLLSPEYRATADWILFRLMRESGLESANKHSGKFRRSLARAWSETRALYYFVGVRVFGASCIKPRHVELQDKIFVE